MLEKKKPRKKVSPFLGPSEADVHFRVSRLSFLLLLELVVTIFLKVKQGVRGNLNKSQQVLDHNLTLS